MINNPQIIQQNTQKRMKGVCDIVFVIDLSGSMIPFIEGLKSHIENFIDSLKSGNQNISSLDYRLGIVAHNNWGFSVLDFTPDINRFKKALEQLEPELANEFTLPAIDRALDFPWRKATRIIASFTDEPLKIGTDDPFETGYEPEFQISKLDELKKKINDLHIHLYFMSPQCDVYEELAKVPRTICSWFNDTFETYDFSELLNTMGKTLSASLSQQDASKNPNPDLYSLRGKFPEYKI